MNFNSIKWRLQIWYALLLATMLTGLAITAYNLERGKVLRQIDVAIRNRIRTLADRLDRPPPPPHDGDDFGPPGQRRLPFHLSPQEETLFPGDNQHAFYFRLTDRDDREIARSSETAKPLEPVREIEIVTPSDNHILVGCSTASELAELRHTAVKLGLFGGAILFLGFAIGGLLVSRALSPITDISSTAEKISTGDLTQRINIDETKSELGRLATILNTTFSRLESAFAQQKRFAADAAHELRTPVSVLIAQTHAALMRKRSYEENLQTIEACHRAAQRMRRLIVSLLQLARLDAGQEPVQRLQFDLLPVVSECVELVKTLADETNIKLILEAAPARVFGDPEQIHQLVTNLLTNAVQYNRHGGQVRVKIQSDHDHTVLTVADTGIGIPAADLPHIFDRFYRAEKSRSSGNAGLGLAISKAIADAHNGTIEISSAENSGTTFTVRLPSTDPAHQKLSAGAGFERGRTQV